MKNKEEPETNEQTRLSFLGHQLHIQIAHMLNIILNFSTNSRASRQHCLIPLKRRQLLDPHPLMKLIYKQIRNLINLIFQTKIMPFLLLRVSHLINRGGIRVIPILLLLVEKTMPQIRVLIIILLLVINVVVIIVVLHHLLLLNVVEGLIIVILVLLIRGGATAGY